MPRKITTPVAVGIVLAIALWVGWQIRKCSLLRVDKIIVSKAERKMVLYAHGIPLRSYHVALGNVPSGAKHFEGDGRTPEGKYYISGRNPDSKYHLSLRISYPSEADKDYARRSGHSPGGDIMIHGLPNGADSNDSPLFQSDWTAGCIALTNGEIEEIWHRVPDGTPIEILP